jgi:shikimate kinase
MKRFFLTGFMGSGKTTLGLSLAARMNMPFVDLDALIQSREGCSVSDIFAEVGETGFRHIEQAHLHTLLKYKKVVVSTGGGTPCFFDNMDWMNRFGVSIYLKTPSELLYSRLKGEAKHRPLLKRFNHDELLPFIKITVRQREEFYNKAHLTILQESNQMGILDELEEMLLNFKKPSKKV